MTKPKCRKCAQELEPSQILDDEFYCTNARCSEVDIMVYVPQQINGDGAEEHP